MPDWFLIPGQYFACLFFHAIASFWWRVDQALLLCAVLINYFRQWLQTDYDEQGRPSSVRDGFGTALTVRYGKDGLPETWESPRGRLQVTRDDAGRVTAVQTPGGTRLEGTTDAGRGTTTTSCRTRTAGRPPTTTPITSCCGRCAA